MKENHWLMVLTTTLIICLSLQSAAKVFFFFDMNNKMKLLAVFLEKQSKATEMFAALKWQSTFNVTELD